MTSRSTSGWADCHARKKKRSSVYASASSPANGWMISIVWIPVREGTQSPRRSAATRVSTYAGSLIRMVIRGRSEARIEPGAVRLLLEHDGARHASIRRVGERPEHRETVAVDEHPLGLEQPIEGRRH